MNSENWKEIELNYCGTRVMGIYKVSGKLVTVVYGSSIKTAQLGILPAEMLAHMCYVTWNSSDERRNGIL
jgi:hypothetical protein